MTANKNLHLVIFASMILFFMRLLYIGLGPIDLAPDEAHYWEWSRYLDWSYYSKPPMVAWLIHVSTSVFGDTLIGVRFFSVLILSFLTIIAFLIGRRVYNENAGLWAAILIMVTPEFSAGGLLMTPDVPTLFFWAVALYILTGIDFSHPPKRSDIKIFIKIGVLIGFAGLSKYTAALFYPLLGLYLLVDKHRRQWLRFPHVYIGGIVSAFMQYPVLYWNITHEWISFQHVWGQAAGNADFDGVKSIGNFLAGQLGVIGPVTFVLLLWIWLRLPKFKLSDAKKHHALQMLWWFSAPIFLLFVFKSLDAKVQPNWPVLSIWGGLMCFAIYTEMSGKIFKKIVLYGLVLSGCISVIGHDTFMVRKVLDITGAEQFSAKKDPLKPVQGWRGIAHALDVLSLKVGGEKVILTTRYQTAGELGFYMEGQPKVLYVNLGDRRQNQYDLWDWPDLNGKIVLYVHEGKKPHIPEGILKGFMSCRYVGSVASQRMEIILRQAHMYVCAGYRGIERSKPDVY